MEQHTASSIASSLGRIADALESMSEHVMFIKRSAEQTNSHLDIISDAFANDGAIDAIAHAVLNRPIVARPEDGDSFFDPNVIIEQMADDDGLPQSDEYDEPHPGDIEIEIPTGADDGNK